MAEITITVKQDGGDKVIKATSGANLLSILKENNIPIHTPCGGCGFCTCCKVEVFGKNGSTELLACRNSIYADCTIRVVLFP